MPPKQASGRPCEACDGSGTSVKTRRVDCKNCDGTGACSAGRGNKFVCPVCSGEGEEVTRDRVKCLECKAPRYSGPDPEHPRPQQQVKKEAKDVLALVEKLSKLLDNRNWEGICELASSAQQRGCSGLAKEARNHLRGHVDEISSKGVVVAETPGIFMEVRELPGRGAKGLRTELLLLHKAALKAGLDDFASDLVERLGSAMPAEPKLQGLGFEFRTVIDG
eukprot:s196_g13.t1